MPKSDSKKLPRNETIDLLRGTAIIIMILIHSNAYFLSNTFVKNVWNISQFVVATFIFCSGYLYFQKALQTNKTFFSIGYLTKRFVRLFIPYYIFLFFYLFLIAVTAQNKLSTKYILENITVMGGVDLSWLVLLFTYVMVLLPFVDLLAKKSKKLFSFFFFVSLASSIFLLFFKSPIYFRYIMWLPWSLIVYFSWYVAKYEKNKKDLLKLLFISCTTFIVSALILQMQGKSLIQFDNKYPPNLFHLSYGIFITLLLYMGLHGTRSILNPVKNWLNFFSFYSYPIFFVHFWILFAIDGVFKAHSFHWVVLFLVVMALTIIVQIGINRLKKLKIT